MMLQSNDASCLSYQQEDLPVNNKGAQLPLHLDLIHVILLHLAPLVGVQSMADPDKSSTNQMMLI